MEYGIVIGLIVCAFVVILLIKFIQGIFKLVLYAILILILISAVFGYFFVSDSSKLIDGLRTKDTLFILKDGNKTITGFTITSMNLTTAKSLTGRDLSEFSSYYVKKDYKKMLGDNQLLFIIDRKAFPKTESFDPDAVLEFLKEDKKELDVTNKALPKMPDSRAMAFSLLVFYSFKEDSGYLIKEYKSGNVIIYPETFVFKTFKFFLGKK